MLPRAARRLRRCRTVRPHPGSEPVRLGGVPGDERAVQTLAARLPVAIAAATLPRRSRRRRRRHAAPTSRRSGRRRGSPCPAARRSSRRRRAWHGARRAGACGVTTSSRARPRPPPSARGRPARRTLRRPLVPTGRRRPRSAGDAVAGLACVDDDRASAPPTAASTGEERPRPHGSGPCSTSEEAEGEGFEPSVDRKDHNGFETAPFNHSGTPPRPGGPVSASGRIGSARFASDAPVHEGRASASASGLQKEGRLMESTASRRVLVVANRTAATPELLEAVKRYRA